jgi:hypothetical protein
MPPRERRAITRADVPAEFTAETIRALPLSTLRQLADHRNAILTGEEQQAFDRALHEVMRGTAERVSRRLSRSDWASLRGEGAARGGGPGRPSSRADEQLRRLTRRIDQQLEVAETLAPGVDWSFTQLADSPAGQPPALPAPTEAPTTTDPPPATAPTTTTTTTPNAAQSDGAIDDSDGTVSDLEQRITEQVELVEVMSEIAEMSRRTYALEQQRDLQSTRSVFFGFVVSVAVLAAGWAPLVAANDWGERIWIITLTLGTCLIAAGVYGLVRHQETKNQAGGEPGRN